jgi:hypothetical protein
MREDMDELSRRIALRDQLRRKRAAAESPQQRLEAMGPMQEQTWHTLRANPAGYAFSVAELQGPRDPDRRRGWRRTLKKPTPSRCPSFAVSLRGTYTMWT